MGTSFYGLLLVVGCSLGWAGLDLLRKVLAGRVDPLPLLVALTIGQLPGILAWAVVEGSWSLDAGYWLPGLASAVLNVVANLAYLRSVQLSPLSSTIPLLSLGPVFTTLLAIPLLGQVPSATQAAGIGCVVVGALVLNSRRGRGTFLLGLRRERGAPLMMAVAMIWAMTLPLDRLAIDHSSPAIHSLILSIVVGIFAAALAGRRALEPIPEGATLPLVASVVVGTTALVLQMLAIQLVLVGLVETFKRGLGCLAAILVGRWVFCEPITLPKALAVVFMAAGVALILL